MYIEVEQKSEIKALAASIPHSARKENILYDSQRGTLSASDGRKLVTVHVCTSDGDTDAMFRIETLLACIGKGVQVTDDACIFPNGSVLIR